MFHLHYAFTEKLFVSSRIDFFSSSWTYATFKHVHIHTFHVIQWISKKTKVYPKTKTRSIENHPKGSGTEEARAYRVNIRRGLASINLIVMSSDAERKTLKYTLCGDYVYACGKGGESIFLLICLSARSISARWLWDLNKSIWPSHSTGEQFASCFLQLRALIKYV